MKTNRIFLRLSALALLSLSLTHVSSGQSWLTAGNVVAAGNVLGATNNADLQIITSNTSRITVLGTGNVGVGTTAPTSALHVTSTGLDPTPNVAGTEISAGIIELTRNGAPGYPYIDFNDGTLGEDFDARLIYSNFGGFLDRLRVNGAEFSVDRSVMVGNAYSGTGIATSPNSLFVENELGVGYLVNPGTYALYVNGTAWAAGGWFGSDARWKQNVTPIEGALAKVLRLNGVTYDFRSKEYPDLRFPEGRQIGFIAQDVEQVVPEVVTTNNDGYKGVAYQNITPLLVEAIKEQQREIERLRAIVERLEASGSNPSVDDKPKTESETPSLGEGLRAPADLGLNAR